MTTKLGGWSVAAVALERWPTIASRQSRPSRPAARARRMPNDVLLWLSRSIESAGSPGPTGSKQLPVPKLRNARDRSGRAELFGCVAEVLDRGAGRLAALELLAVAVDPDHRHVHLQQRGDVVCVAGADMDPAFLAADAARRLFEVDWVRLVAAHLLCGDDEVQFGTQVAAGDAEQFVVDVGDDADLVAFAEPVHCRVRLPERQPVSDAVGQELSS